MPKVSVILPTYNRARFLEEAIQSVLTQDFQDYEIIVLDDGSNDNTKEIIKSFKSKKIRYFFQNNKGRSRARNRAMELAQGQYLAFLDSDDVFLPGKLTKQVKCLDEHPEVGMVYASALTMDENGRKLNKKYRATSSGFIYKEVAFVFPLTVILPAAMVRREVFDKVGKFDVKMDRFEDSDMWRRITQKYLVLAVREPLCQIRHHRGNLMERPSKLLRALDNYVSKVFREDSQLSWFYKQKAASNLYRQYYQAVRNSQQWRRMSFPFYLRAVVYWPPLPITQLISQIILYGYQLFVVLFPGPRTRKRIKNLFKINI